MKRKLVGITVGITLLGMAGMANLALALTCADLDGSYVFSQETSPVYLGFFGSAYASDSIMNTYGTYGSPYSSTSVRNEYGTYGSPYSSYSANNEYTGFPPQIYKNGQLIAYLTTNTFISGGISLAEIDAVCNFYSSSPVTEPLPPPPPSTISASDGEYTDQIIIVWLVVEGASQYNIYYSESVNSTKYFVDSTTSDFMIITGTVPDKVYYFWVSASNSGGEGILSNPDTGYMAIDESLTRTTSCGVGICAGNTGIETFIAGAWSNDTCDPFEGAIAEICGDGIDQDCNGADLICSDSDNKGMPWLQLLLDN